MKKRLRKKLVVVRETLVTLNDEQMLDPRGAMTTLSQWCSFPCGTTDTSQSFCDLPCETVSRSC